MARVPSASAILIGGEELRQPPPASIVCVGNLEPETKIEALRAEFSKVGAVTRAERFEGCAVIQFTTEMSATAAVSRFHNQIFGPNATEGLRMRVDFVAEHAETAFA